MSPKLSFSLLLSLVFLALSTVAARRQNHYGLSVEKVLSPYRTAYDAAVNNANNHLEQFKTIIQWDSATEDSTKKSDEPLKLVPINVAEAQSADAQPDDEENALNDANNRMLVSNPCHNNATLVDTLVNIFTCGGKTVTQSQYEARLGEGCIARYNVTRKMCFCSYEFYGDLCQNFNSWTCQLDRLSYPEKCGGADSFNYVYSMDGVPPCYQVADGQNITITTGLVCRSTNTQYNFEGVKPSRYQVVEQPNLGSSPFNYVIEGDQVKLTFEPSEFRQEITFTNWNLMSEPYVIETSLSSSQILGNSTINAEVSFTAPLTSFAAFGRYYYEIIIKVGDMGGLNTILTNNYYYGGYFEKAGYKEPSAPSKVNTGLAIGLSILGALLLIGVFFAVRRFRNKKRLAAYRERANSLFADDRQD